MAKRKGAYKSEKRKKELMRQKKQEIKRQKRIHKDEAPEGNTEPTSESGDGEEAAPSQ